MHTRSIILTGITGFIGSHIAEALVKEGFHIIGFIRSNSNKKRLRELPFFDEIQLVNIDEPDFKDKLANFSPKVLLHCAWGGVTALERNDWVVQSKNITFTAELLQLSIQLGIKKVVCFGSQAEYGNFNGRVNESFHCKPVSAYGAAKLATSQIVEAFCTENSLDWFWLRLFSVYGTREGDSWFIPSVIRHALDNTTMNLTECEQRYDYLHVDDLSSAIVKVITLDGPSGLYNLSSNNSVTLRSIIEKVRTITKSKTNFNFGALPYRPNQVMHMEGDSERFFKQFDFNVKPQFDSKIEELVRYYKLKMESK